MWKKKRSFRSTLYEDQEQAFIESHPKMDPKKAKAIFKKSELTNKMMAELPKRKHHSGGLNSIAVPVPREGLKIEYQSLSDPVLIEQVLLQRNIRHFCQAENTPLSGQETIAKIGFGASSDYADQIINGNANLDILTDDPMSIKLLKVFGTK